MKPIFPSVMKYNSEMKVHDFIEKNRSVIIETGDIKGRHIGKTVAEPSVLCILKCFILSCDFGVLIVCLNGTKNNLVIIF